MDYHDLLKVPSILTIISTAVNVILLLVLKTKYNEAKQVNQATKEDIGDITKIVEEIKTNLSKETETLKAQLLVTNQHKINIKSAERQALIDYVGKVAAWFYYISTVPFQLYTIETYKEIDNVQLEINRRLYEVNVADANVQVFFTDMEFIKLQVDLMRSIQEFATSLALELIQLRLIFKKGEVDLSIKDSISNSEKYNQIHDKAISYAGNMNKVLTPKCEVAFRNINRLYKYTNNRMIELSK